MRGHLISSGVLCRRTLTSEWQVNEYLLWLDGAAAKAAWKCVAGQMSFRALLFKGSSIPFIPWKMLVKKTSGCHRLLSYTEMF